MEEWRPVMGFEGLYEVSSIGRVRNRRGYVLKQSVTSWGYWRVGLFRQGEGTREQRVHRLVALAFIPLIEGKTHVNHINGDKQDNRFENLEWMTKLENEAHAHAMGRNHAITNPNRGWKLTVDNVIDIRTRKAAGESGMALAREYGVSNGYLYKVCHGTKRERG